MSEPGETVGWLPRPAEALFGEGATAEDAYGLLTADVPAEAWIAALTVARDELGCRFFDWLSAVDEPGTGFRVCAHVAALPAPGAGAPLRRLLLRTTVAHEAPSLPTATEVYAGAAWHERETHEMFGVAFPGHPHLAPLLLPDSFEGHPLRKDFVLAARVAKAWPGAKEPGESGHGGPKRRQMLPPGVPDPNEWGPLKGQLPPAPARPARSRAAATDRPRRARSAGAGSASQRTPKGEEPTGEAPKSEPPKSQPPTNEPPKSEATPEAAPKPETPPTNEPPTPPGDAPWRRPASGEAEPGADTTREPREPRDASEPREPSEPRDASEPHEPRDASEPREPREREGEED